MKRVGILVALAIASVVLARDARVFPLSPIGSGGTGGSSGGSGGAGLPVEASPPLYVYNDGGSYFLTLDGGTSAEPTAGQGITVSGSRVTCAMHSATDAGCISPGDQRLYGIKRFDSVMTAEGSYAQAEIGNYSILAVEGVAAKRIAPALDDNAIILQGRQSRTSITPDVLVQSKVYRDAGAALSISDPFSVFFQIDWAGNVIFGPSVESSGAGYSGITKGGLKDNSGISGHYALQGSDGLYLNIGGNLPEGYGGVHGSVSAGNMTPMDAGFLFELRNPQTGGTSDARLIVDYQGGIAQLGAFQTNTLQPCGRSGSGVSARGALDGDLMYTVDDKRWHRCNAADAGWPLLAAEATQFYQYADTGRDVASISSGRCTDYSKSVSGTAFAAGDSCTVGFPRDTVGGVSETLWSCWPSDSTVISVRVCCNSNTACDPSNQTVYYNLTCPDGSCYP